MTLDTISRGPRILIETDNAAAALAQTAACEEAGYSVVVCPGPHGLPSRTATAVDGGWCPSADFTDVVVFDLDTSKPASWELLEGVRRAYPDTPVVVELPVEVAREHDSQLRGCHVVYPFDMDRLVGAVSCAAATHEKEEREA
jgi:CheY-like chemotaxis protein